MTSIVEEYANQKAREAAREAAKRAAREAARKEKSDMVRKMLQNGVEKEVVMKCTDLSAEEVDKIEKSLLQKI